MALVLAIEGCVEALDLLSGAWGDMSIGLYAAAHLPGPSDDYATYASIEATFPGYARRTLGGWLPAVAPAGLPAQTQGNIVTFTRNAAGPPCQVYGYFVLLETGTLFFAESDPSGPAPINNNGDTYQVSPLFSFNQAL